MKQTYMGTREWISIGVFYMAIIPNLIALKRKQGIINCSFFSKHTHRISHLYAATTQS